MRESSSGARFALLLSFQELNSIANQEEKEVEGLSTSTAA